MNILNKIREWNNKPLKEGRSHSWGFALYMVAILVGIIGIFCGIEAYHSWRETHQWQLPFRPLVVVIEKEEPKELKPAEFVEERESWIGLASYYSHEGCVGCNGKQIMSNGKPFIEEAITIAYNRVPLGSYVRVTNLKTGDSIVAEVTDTGGFEELGRIADLSLGTKNAINCSDICEVEIELIK